MPGYTGRMLRVDLTAGRIEAADTPAFLRRDFLGGRGMGVALVAKAITEQYDSERMPLVFASGPLVATEAPTSGRSSVVSRSPLTGTVCDCSVGGRFGTELKKSGFDLIEITGRSDGWVVLDVSDGRASLEPAGNLAGLNVTEARAMLGDRGSDALIGIAGEQGVRFASIVFDGHYLAGRGGLGAVMGAKRLKAVRLRGTGKITVGDPRALREARDEIMRLLRASQAVFGELGLSEFGTAALVDLIHSRRMEPTGNFRKTFFENAGEYSGYRLRNLYRATKTGCRGCPILCKKVGSNGEVMPEYETASHFGALNGNSDPRMIVEANRVCNDFGIDTITAAATIACHAEIEGRRIGPDEAIGILREIGGMTTGRGRMLAEGSLRYARSAGRPEASMSVKGLELPAYDPRGAYGMALAYATSNRGGCHLRAYPISHEILRKPVATDRFTFEGKARIIKIAEDMNAVVDSLTACKFVFFAASLEEYAKALSAVTGEAWDTQSLLRTGERISVLERCLNSNNGFRAEDDDLPARFFSEEGSSSQNVRIAPIDREAFLASRSNYYRIRGCGTDGAPSADTIGRLGLGEYLPER
ncbi:MAG: aldehyde ferredoxin oxidoreductase family protein [Thermodesulfovibrionales bacterium]